MTGGWAYLWNVYMCAKGFLALLKKVEKMGNMKGVAMGKGGPKITHLLTDDNILFYRA